MKLRRLLFLAAACMISCAAFAQAAPAPAPPDDQGPVVLDWTPPALSALSSQAAVKNSFTFDRNMLQAAASVMSSDDPPTRQAINHLDGISVHLLRFGQNGIPDEDAVNAIRDSYHLRGWKHVVTTNQAGGPMRDGTTDVWVVMDGVNLRGAVVLAETPRSLTLVTVAGNLSPVDLLHLRGHFGIPKFDGGDLGTTK
ncbi:MAG TPA: hypothetical protein VG267_13670 [Terracidiphilus sp.]|jgi:ABC-type nitrate/sulfonate/bicarbonate transport system substrate-binding protein|nr:hypothetical protein [Terracidiphilus sp.]